MDGRRSGRSMARMVDGTLDSGRSGMVVDGTRSWVVQIAY